MTVARLRAEMPNHEFVYWYRYHARKAQLQELEAAKMSNGR